MTHLSSRIGARLTPVVTAACLIMSGAWLGIASAEAAEGAQGFYSLGIGGPLAAVAPPTGVYFQNDTVIYSGKASTSEQLPYVGRVTSGVKADVYVDVPTLLWQTPLDVANVRLGITASQPFGYKYVVGRIITGNSESTLPGGRASAGDLVVGAPLTWSDGRLHLGLTPSLNIPTGDYNSSSLPNMALHRWAGNISTAATWLDTTSGLEASAVIGMAFNGTNPATHYRSGTEFHTELALSQYFSPTISVGALLGYSQQVTADSGLNSVLGDFKGRVWAAGGTASYVLPIDGKPVALRVKVLREFSVQNRLTGTSGSLSIGFSL